MGQVFSSRAVSQLVIAAGVCWCGAGGGFVLRECDAPGLLLLAALATWWAARRPRARRACLYAALASSTAAWSSHTLSSVRAPLPSPNPLVARLLTADSGKREVRLLLAGSDGTRRTVRLPITGIDSFDRLAAGVVPGALVSIPLSPDELLAGRLRAHSAASIVFVAGPRGLWRLHGTIQAIRARFARHAQQRLWQETVWDRQAAALLLAMVAGRDDFISAPDWEDLRASGLAHVAVASGVQIAIVAWATGLLLSPWFGRHHPLRRCAALLSVAIACGVLLPPDPPILRAGMALGWVVIARSVGRGMSALGALAIAAMALLWDTPAIGGSLSFSLTVGATMALIAAGCLASRARWVLLLLAPASVTHPLIVGAFGRVAPWGVIANLVIAPAALPAVIGGWLLLFWPDQWWGERLIHGTAEAAAWWILATAREIACWPWSGRLVAPVGAAWVLASLGAAAAWWLGSWRLRVAGCLGWVILSAWPGVFMVQRSAAALELVDVGQGQSVLMTDAQHAILIDAGPARTRGASANLLDRLRARGVNRLTRLIVTHADSDHIGGMRDLLAATPPDCLSIPASAIDSPRLRPLIAAAAARGIPIDPLAAGDVWSEGELRAEVLHPRGGQRGDHNDCSVVLQLRAGAIDALAMGDASRAVEQDLSQRGALVPTEMLIVGHHGSSSSTGFELLRAVRARLAAISCGQDNRFGHPHPKTLEALRAPRVPTFITARHGTLVCERTSGHWQVDLPLSRIGKRYRVRHEENR